MFTGIEAQVRAFGRLVRLVVIGLVLAVAALVGISHHKPAPAPCVTSSGAPCTFTPHAPRSVAP